METQNTKEDSSKKGKIKNDGISGGGLRRRHWLFFVRLFELLYQQGFGIKCALNIDKSCKQVSNICIDNMCTCTGQGGRFRSLHSGYCLGCIILLVTAVV